MFPRLLNDLLGTKIQDRLRLRRPARQFLAIERGELDGLFMSGWSGPGRAYVREKMKEGKMTLLVQMSATGDPAHSDTPTILLADQERPRPAIVELLLSRLSLGRPFLAPPGIPADRVAMLRDAFRKAATDPDLLEEAARLRLAIDPIFGEEAQALINRLYGTPPRCSIACARSCRSARSSAQLLGAREARDHRNAQEILAGTCGIGADRTQPRPNSTPSDSRLRLFCVEA